MMNLTNTIRLVLITVPWTGIWLLEVPGVVKSQGLLTIEFPSVLAQAPPIIPAQDGTGTTVTPDGHRFLIQGGTRSQDGVNLFHSLTRFQVNSGQVANFVSHPAIQNILTRVVGGEASLINGLIQVTGGHTNLFIMNPAGIIFGGGARLDVSGSFMATTATGIGWDRGWFQAFGKNDYQNLLGSPQQFVFDSQPGSIINAGILRVPTGESLSLLGGTVINTGQLEAPGGMILLSSVPGGNTVRMSQSGHLLSLELQPTSQTPLLPFSPPSLPQLLTGQGVPQATGVEVNGQGQVILTATQQPLPSLPGTTIVSGSINTTDLQKNGGQIYILGDKVGVFQGNIEANGKEGGGQIRVGGDYRGSSTLPMASRTHIDQRSTLSAKALQNGDGGQIVLWSRDVTGFLGRIEAQGSPQGRGGFVEVSSQGSLLFQGGVNLMGGSLGTLLLDPIDITIVDGDQAPHDSHVVNNHLLSDDLPKESLTISKLFLESLSADANVILEATNNITINDLASNQLAFQAQSGSITFKADADQDGVGNFSMKPDDQLITQGGNLKISGFAVTTGPIITNGGSVLLQSNSHLTTGDINLKTGSNINPSPLTSSSQTLKLESTNGNITTGVLSAGSIEINAQRNINISQINTSLPDSKNSRDVQVISQNGLVSIPEINTSNPQGKSGHIDVEGLEGIQIGKINTQGLEGGNVNLTTSSRLTLGTVNAQGNERGGNLILTGYEIDLLGGANSIISNGNLTLQPALINQNIKIGWDEPRTLSTYHFNPSLDIGQEDLAALQDGFQSITIGLLEGDGEINITGNSPGNPLGITLSDPVTIQSSGNLGRIVAEGNIMGVDNSSIRLIGGEIKVNDITANRGINLSSNQGNITTGNLITNEGKNKTGGAITIHGQNYVKTGDIKTTGETQGGALKIQSQGEIETGKINVSSSSGQGGSVSLESTQNIRVFAIKAMGETLGGDIKIKAGGNFQAIGTFNDVNQVRTSLSNVSGKAQGNANITIEYNPVNPFVVGDSTKNGTEGAITTGKNVIYPVQSFTNPINLGSLTTVYKTNSSSVASSTPVLNSSSESESQSSSNGINNSLISSEINTNVTNQSAPNSSTSTTTPDPNSLKTNDTTKTNSDATNLNPNQSTSTPEKTTTTETVISEQNPASEGNSSPSLSPVNSLSSQEVLTVDPILTSGENSSITSAELVVKAPVNNTTVLIGVSKQTYTGSESALNSNPTLISVNSGENLWKIDQSRSREFQNNLSLVSHGMTERNFQQTLNAITQKTSVKPGIIYVTLAENQLELRLFLPNGKGIFRSVSVPKETVLQVGRDFTNAIRNPRQTSLDYLKLGEQLYDWLITPLNDLLKENGINNLIFSMDGGLRTLPIAALYDGQEFLIEKYSLALIPSLSLTDTRHVDLRNSQVLAMGISEFPTHSNLMPLPGVPIELSTIVGKLWPGVSLLNDKFTINNLKLQRHEGKYGIIHLATHGEFQSGGSENSYIQFWDTKLQLNQLRELKFYDPPVELLVLSACNTAVGDEEAELGFAGLAVQAGVRSVIASLWYVSDAGTLALMTQFYQHLRVEPIRAEALRQAQLAMLRGEIRLENGSLQRSGETEKIPLPLQKPGTRNLSHPYYWSAFTLIGSPW